CSGMDNLYWLTEYVMMRAGRKGRCVRFNAASPRVCSLRGPVRLAARRLVVKREWGRERRTQVDAQCIDPRTADLPFSPAPCHPRRLLRAPDPRTGARLAKPRRGGNARLGRQERQFGKQTLRRFEVLGGRLCGHAA